MYQEILGTIVEPITIHTLGGQSTITIYNQDFMVIVNASGNSYHVDEALFNTVYQRYQQLPTEDRVRAGQYTHPLWEDCPNLISPPYIAAVINHFTI
ncbi:hypothetical protein E3A20_15240 [Planctomyces bekefii]|uniref:Uncharacterized protein n=1 Tax=Planctomyces bekefii TaxID=1653850 RepID=A0A5C6M455_9PLAN|nr:hypothetical protein E3A20_15240 [Planctomyces bekefii]